LSATSRWFPSTRPLADALGVALAGLLLAAAPASGGEPTLGGDVRLYPFLRVDDPGDERVDAELGIARLKLGGPLAGPVSFEAHAVLSVVSPAATNATAIAAGDTRRFLPLQDVLADDGDVRVQIELDRLTLTWERPAFRLVAGRQAITWGVNFFWPVLDLFAPFPPERIDREYKPGVDALRLTIPVGSLSEIELVAAGQGKDLSEDGSVGALARIHLGAADLGLMAGRFHGDTVAGGFVTANVIGTGVRGELAFTESGDPFDATIDRRRFWRASAGVDRQLTATLALTAEIAWNGFGTAQPREYPVLAASDRVRRGEITSLGEWYGGAALTWQAHPLLSVVGTGLVNLSDGSALLLPHADWSLADDVSVVFGGLFGIGPGPGAGGRLRSEYGAVPAAVYAAIKLYF
jgi:hypothetical protein